MSAEVRLVSTRGRHEIAELGMSCDGREVLRAANGGTRWTAVAHYVGTASAEDGSTAEVDAASPVALTTSADGLSGILSTDQPAPAVWFTAGRAELTAVGEGTAGVFRKRPAGVRVRIPQGELHLVQIGRMLSSGRTVQANQEADFLAALSR